MRRKQHLTRTVLLLVLAFVLLAGALACGMPRRPGLDTSDTIGANAEVGAVKLRNVLVEPPPDGDYLAGDDAIVRLAVFNDAPRPDALVDVRSGAADRVTILWDRDCDGEGEPVTRIPLLAEGTAPGAGDDPSPFYLQVHDLAQRVWEGTTVPIRFTFEQAGAITVDAMVLADEGRVTLPPRGCGTSAPSTTPSAAG